MNKSEVAKMLKRLEVAHRFYVDANEEDRQRILAACEPIIEVLMDVKFYEVEADPNSFVILYVLYGDVFLKSLGFKDLNNYLSKVVL